MSLYNVNNILETGDFIDFKSDSGKWYYAEVIATRNTEIQLKYITFKSQIGEDNYRKCWIDIRLRCINIYIQYN